jgi:hypothetical protein
VLAWVQNARRVVCGFEIVENMECRSGDADRSYAQNLSKIDREAGWARGKRGSAAPESESVEQKDHDQQ